MDSPMGRRWQVYAAAGERGIRLAEELHLSPFLVQLLINRGLSTPETILEYLNPSLDQLRSPFEIPDMDKAVARLLLARERHEKVVVFGDYDVDGVTGSAQLLTALRLLGIDSRAYLPDRYSEGYGLNRDAIDQFARDGVAVVITVDCGVSNADEIRALKAHGLDVLITDHHTLPDPLPPADAVVHPKRIPGPHPSKHLSGAGVAFKVAWGLLEKAGAATPENIEKLIDLAAIGTIGDVVPLLGENRVLTAAGLKVIQKMERPGLRSLLHFTRTKKKVGVREVGFQICPRLNAAGRLEHASQGLDLLMAEDAMTAQSMARDLENLNRKRRTLGDSALQEAEVLLQGGVEDAADRKFLLVSGEGWHIGVIGIIAARLAEKYYRPAILVSSHNGVCRGSARSIDGFDVHELLATCSDLFVAFGGHRAAAGFEILPENISKLRERLTVAMDTRAPYVDFIPKIKIDAVLAPSQLHVGLAMELEAMAPFGLGNPEPLFMLPQVTVEGARTVASGAHLKLKCRINGARFEAMGFRQGALADSFMHPQQVDLACHIERDSWNGADSLLVKLADVRFPVIK